MKNFLCLLFSVILIFVCCSCSGNPDVSNATASNSSSNKEISSQNNNESSQPQSSENSSENVSSENTSSENTSSNNPSSNVSQNGSNPSNVDKVVISSKFTVFDPDNLLGLSTVKKGFSYGIASNGKPHNQSIINQTTFDNFKNVEALALDTKTNEKIMYLTFDNGYEYQNLTADILDTLKEKNVKAAFFVTLSYAKSNKSLVRRMIDEGHIVGNHSTTHPVFPDITRTKMAEEIAQLDEYLINNFSYSSSYFRFPTGAYSECSLELVTSLGYKSIFWSLAHADWDTSAQKGEQYAYETVTSRFHSGAVILLHAVSSDNASALGRIIDTAKNQGYTFKTLDDYYK